MQISVNESTLQIPFNNAAVKESISGVYLEAQRFPANVPEQGRRRAQRILGSLLQGEDDSTWVLSQSIDQVLELPTHLWNTRTPG